MEDFKNNRRFCRGCAFQHANKTKWEENEVSEVSYVKLINEIYMYGLSAEQYAELRKCPKTLKKYWRSGCPFSEPSLGLDHVKLIRKRKRNITKYDLLNQKIFISREEKILVSAQTEFFCGIKNNDVTSILTSIANGAEPRGCSKEIPFPLHYLAKQGYDKAIKVLLDNGVPTNTVDKDGKTPLYLSALHGHREACTLLLQHGACYRHRQHENNPLLACQSNSYLTKLFTKISQAFRLARRGDKRLLRMIKGLSYKDVSMVHAITNPVDSMGRTITAVALQYGHEDLAERILTFRLQVSSCV